MNRRNFIKSIGILSILPPIGLYAGHSKQLNNKSTFFPAPYSKNTIIIIPSDYLLNKYNIKLTPIPCFMDVNNNPAIVRCNHAYRHLNTTFNNIIDNEPFVDSILNYAHTDLSPKTIYNISVQKDLNQSFLTYIRCSKQEVKIKNT